MRTRASLVHLGRADGPIAIAHGHGSFHVVSIVTNDLEKVFDIDANVGSLFDFQMLGLVGADQVSDLLVIDFQVGNADKKP